MLLGCRHPQEGSHVLSRAPTACCVLPEVPIDTPHHCPLRVPQPGRPGLGGVPRTSQAEPGAADLPGAGGGGALASLGAARGSQDGPLTRPRPRGRGQGHHQPEAILPRQQPAASAPRTTAWLLHGELRGCPAGWPGVRMALVVCARPTRAQGAEQLGHGLHRTGVPSTRCPGESWVCSGCPQTQARGWYYLAAKRLTGSQ